MTVLMATNAARMWNASDDMIDVGSTLRTV
jgi:hypothetical protein